MASGNPTWLTGKSTIYRYSMIFILDFPIQSYISEISHMFLWIFSIFLYVFPFFDRGCPVGSHVFATLRRNPGEARLEPAVLGLGQAASHGLHQGAARFFSFFG